MPSNIGRISHQESNKVVNLVGNSQVKQQNETENKTTNMNSQANINVSNADSVQLKVNVVNPKLIKQHPAIVFITDDGALADYTFTKPIFQAENIPCGICLITSKVGKDPAFMTKVQALELQGMGWEVLSHSVTHTTPYITTMTDADAEAQYRDSKAWLLTNGFNVQSYATPGGLSNLRGRLLAKKYYRSARVSDFGVDGLNVIPVQTYALKTIWIDSTATAGANARGNSINTLAYYQYFIDKAVTDNKLLIISFHSQDAKVHGYGTMLKQVVQYAKSKAPVMNLRDALDKIGL